MMLELLVVIFSKPKCPHDRHICRARGHAVTIAINLLTRYGDELPEPLAGLLLGSGKYSASPL